MNPIRLLKRSIQGFVAKDTLTLGAALAYYTAFSLAPLLLIAVAIAGHLFGEEAARRRLSEDITTAVGPAMGEAIEKTLANAAASSSTATLVGIGVMLFGAAGVFGQLQAALNTIWKVPPHSGHGIVWWIRHRLRSFAMVLGAALLLLASLVATGVLSAAGQSLLGDYAPAAQSINRIVSFGIQTLAFAVLFKVMPDCEVPWRSDLLGAVATAGLFTFGKYLLGLYITMARIESAYGAAGSLAVILVWVYYASQIVLFGAQIAQTHAEIRSEA